MIKRLARYGILVAVLLILGGCDVISDRSAKPSPDWSRGLQIGVASLSQPVALQIDGEGHAHLVWYTRLEEVGKLHYAQLDDQAKVLMERDLEIPLSDPHRPQLLLDQRGNMHMAFLAREEGLGGSMKSLFHFLLGDGGKALSEPTRLSLPGKGVESYQMCLGQEGRVEVFWAAQEGIYHLGLDERGDVISPPALIVSQGTDPSAQVDRSGTIHLAWFQEPSPQSLALYYAVFQGLGQSPSPNEVEGVKLTQFGTGMSASLYGPVLGLDMDNVYIFWAIERRTGLEQGTAQSHYVSFPLGQPSPLAPVPIDIVDSDFVTMPSVAEGQRNELAALFTVWLGPSDLQRTKTESPALLSISKPTMQLVMAVFTEGEMMSYQLAAKTGSTSLRPSLVADPASNLHLAWFEAAGFGRYDVYYASTSPLVKASLDRTSPQDVLLKAADLALGMLSGVALLPFVVLWLFLPLLWLVLFYAFVGEEELELKRVKVALGIAIALYMGAKLLLLPSSLLYAPFLDQVPPKLSSALVSGVPLLILALALAAMYAYTRRAERATLFPAFLIFAVTDTLLSLAIYAPGIFGVGS
jgi:hypothetical protein